MISAAELLTRYSVNSTPIAAEIPNYNKARDFILELVSSSPYERKVIDVDLDPDGILAGKCCDENFKLLGVRGVDVYIPTSKRHGLDSLTVEHYIAKGYKYVIIPDSSTNNIEELRMLSDAGIKVLIIDHHICEYTLEDYPENVCIVNNKMEACNCREVSACMLSYLLLANVMASVGLSISDEHYVWSYVSLIADSCKLSDDFISPIIKGIKSFEYKIPYLLSLFKTDFDGLNRNFISYKFVNKINSLARTDNVNVIRELFFSRGSTTRARMCELVSEVNEIYSRTVEETKKFVSKTHTKVESCGEIGFIDLGKFKTLTKLNTQYLINSTGYISSELGKLCNKPVLVVVPDSHTTYKGSLRANSNSIDLIDLKNKLNLSGGGHVGAIGLSINKYDLPDIKNYISMYTFRGGSITNGDFVVIKGDDMGFREFEKVVKLCATHNEVAGGGVPEVYISRTLNYSFSRKDYDRMILFRLGEVVVKCFNKDIDLSMPHLIKPVFEKAAVGIVQ